ncbi:MAG: hypothetical protein H6578_03880 [Chitinophagales bacterium]|nr:hypothetical protein [Chitinophagales bacterium]
MILNLQPEMKQEKTYQVYLDAQYYNKNVLNAHIVIEAVKEMYGAFRLPEMIKPADKLSRREEHKTKCINSTEWSGLGFSPCQHDYTYKDRCMK